MNLYQKPKTILGKYKINEIAYFSKNCRAVASPFGILICDASTGKEEHLLPSPKNEVLSVAFSPEGNIIAGGKADNTIQLWTNWNNYDVPHDEHILKGHDGSVTSVVFSPDGKILASGSNDGTIRLWDASEGSHKSTLKHNGVTSVVFSPDGKILASGSNDGTIRLWESEIRFGQNRCITALDPSTDVTPPIFTDNKSETTVTSVVFSPNGSKLASGYNNGAIHLWNIKNLHNKSIVTLKKHTDSIQSLDFSSDGRTLASGSKDKTICIWDANAAQHLTTLKEHTSTVFSVVFQGEQRVNEKRDMQYDDAANVRSRGEQLVSESSDGSIRFWNTETGKNEETLTGGYIGNIESVVFSPNGQVLASIGNRDWENTIIHFWDVNTGKIKTSITEKVEDLGTVHFSPDSRTFISRKTFHFWDANTGEIKTSITEKVKNLGTIRFSPDSKTLLTTLKESDPHGHSSRDSGEYIHLWDIDTGKIKTSITEKVKDLGTIRFSPDSKTLLTTLKESDPYGYSSRDSGQNIHLWDIDTGEQKPFITEKVKDLKAVHFSPDSKTLLTTLKGSNPHGYSNRDSDVHIHLWDIDTGEQKRSITAEIETFKSVQFSPDGKKVVIIGTQKEDDPYRYSRSRENNAENIYLWDIDTDEQRCFIPDEKSTFKLVKISPNSKTLVGITASTIDFWNVETGKYRKATLDENAHNAEPITFSRDSRLLLCISKNEVNNTNASHTEKSKPSTFCFWDVETGAPISTHLEEMTNNIEFIVLNSDKTKFVSVHSNNLIRLWDVDTGKHQSTFEGAQEDIASVAFSLDNRHLACASRNGMILLWEITK